MDSGSVNGVFIGRPYKITYGPIDGYMNMVLKWNGRKLHDDEDGIYTLFGPVEYYNCRSLYRKCLKSNDPKSCFTEYGYQIMEQCVNHMEWNKTYDIKE